ncbi:hypothetical protein AB0M48_36200 [Lentzea sp. NPDC051208]|uniref:hypothetical protein n=1 Tax=Lentzea sp. NPDC051208 TaxID=3154642 RepID=UPI003423FB05
MFKNLTRRTAKQGLQLTTPLANSAGPATGFGKGPQMRILTRLGAALAVTAALVTTTAGVAAAAAYPSDPFPEECNNKSGCVSGVVHWSNRSATVDVNLFDDRNAGSTTVVVDFYTANGYFGTDTRTANNERITGHPSKEGPVGGINKVVIWLKANIDGSFYYVGTFYRD